MFIDVWMENTYLLTSGNVLKNLIKACCCTESETFVFLYRVCIMLAINERYLF